MTTPEPTDTGDIAAVDPAQQTELDEPEPNDDADDDLADVEDGEVVDLESDA